MMTNCLDAQTITSARFYGTSIRQHTGHTSKVRQRRDIGTLDWTVVVLIMICISSLLSLLLLLHILMLCHVSLIVLISLSLYTYTHVIYHTCIHIHIHICTHLYLYISLSLYIYIYIYIMFAWLTGSGLFCHFEIWALLARRPAPRRRHRYSAARSRRTRRTYLSNDAIGVCDKKTLLRNITHVGISAFRAPNQGLESSSCCWTAGQGLAQWEWFVHRNRYHSC